MFEVFFLLSLLAIGCSQLLPEISTTKPSSSTVDKKSGADDNKRSKSRKQHAKAERRGAFSNRHPQSQSQWSPLHSVHARNYANRS